MSGQCRVDDARDQREALHATRAAKVLPVYQHEAKAPFQPVCPRHRLLTACHRVGSSAAFAELAEVPQADVSGVLARTREPSDAILAALGLERVTEYREKRS